MQLRPYQTDLITRLREMLRRPGTQPLVVAPTGSGKTVCFAYIASRAAERGRRVGILMHRQELINQTSRALADCPHGIVRGDATRDPDAPVQVCSVQTLINRLDRYAFDLVIVDEAHHCTARSYRRILDYYHGARVVGFTATPCRTDGSGLREAGYTDLVLGPDTAWLTEHGYLAPAEVYAPGGIDTTGVRRQGGDYQRGALAAVVDRPHITGCAVDHYTRLCAGVPAIAFCVSVQHAKHVAAEFEAAGYRAASIDGRMDDEQRRQLITALATGELQVLTSCDLISEGVDVPVVTAGIMLRPTQSRALWIQQMGRVLRPAPGKSCAYILDHAGNTARWGLPTTPQEWTLDGAKRREADDSAPAVRICTECFRPHATAPTCPYCGHVYPPQPRAVSVVEGELQRIEERAVKRLEVARADTLEKLLAVAHQRGYKPGWAYYRWHARHKRKATV